MPDSCGLIAAVLIFIGVLTAVELGINDLLRLLPIGFYRYNYGTAY